MCAIANCDGQVLARGWCRKHYKRWHRHGDPLGGAPFRNRPALERFWEKVALGDGCWKWLGFLNDSGYGMFKAYSDRSMMLAHRYSYELHVGPIPEGLQLDHLCRNPACVNPGHLEPVTHEENVRRGNAGHNMRSKTHCPQGHPYAGDNLYVYDGRRHCRACGRAATARHRAKAVIT